MNTVNYLYLLVAAVALNTWSIDLLKKPYSALSLAVVMSTAVVDYFFLVVTIAVGFKYAYGDSFFS